MQSFGYAGTSVPMNRPDPPFNPRMQNQPEMYANQYGDTAVSGSAHVQLGDVIIQNYNRATPQKSLYEVLLASLRFEHLESRLRSVEHALPSTCQWVFSHNQFLAWADLNKIQHQPFLWIKGKPGSGKSTIMKEMLAWIEKAWSQETLTLTYFFNARSSDQLEKSGLGLYRCLLYQILTNCPASRDAFVRNFAAKVSESGNVSYWTSVELQNFHTELIKDSSLPPLVILIDALDEGDEDDVRQVVQHLSHLQQYACGASNPLRVALSSRHYPNISVQRSLSIIVEDTREHDEDIDTYIRSELAHLHGSHFDSLKSHICHRSAGVFLWVVLVIPILKKAYDKGRSFDDLAHHLDEIPADLDHVFFQIISRDSEDFDKCLQLLAWVSFSLDGLSPAELYCAVEHISTPNMLYTQTKQTVAKYLLNCSRGLVEVTKGSNPVVQFIHETVRDYLMREMPEGRHRSASLSRPSARLLFSPQISHMRIAEDCLRYLHGIRIMSPSADDIANCHPLSDYAANNWWRHIRLSGVRCDPHLVNLASELLTEDTSISRWVQACGILYGEGNDVFVGNDAFDYTSVSSAGWLSYEDFYRDERERRESQRANEANQSQTVPSLYFATSTGILELFYHFLSQASGVNAACEPLGYPLTVASCYGREEMVRVLLENGANVNAQGGRYGNALQAASCRGFTKVVQMLLDRGAEVNAVGGQYRTALRGATSMRREHVVQLLLEHGATTDDPMEKYSPLQKAAALGHVGIARLLLSYNANVHRRGRFGNTLTLAIDNERFEMVRLLLEHGANPNEKIRSGRTALHTACAIDSQPLVQLLLEYGADITAISDDGEAIHQVASRVRPEDTRYVLLDPQRTPSPRQLDRQLESQLMETLHTSV